MDEVLRYDSPVQMTLRCAVQDYDLSGVHVRSGQDVILLAGAANRDPDAFINPDQLDINRPKQDHISFGRGIHHCLGTALARLEGRIAFEMLLERFDSLAPAHRPTGVLQQHRVARSYVSAGRLTQVEIFGVRVKILNNKLLPITKPAVFLL